MPSPSVKSLSLASRLVAGHIKDCHLVFHKCFFGRCPPALRALDQGGTILCFTNLFLAVL